jgi:transporter family protein
MWAMYAILGALAAALMTIFGKIGLKNIDPTFATGIRSFFMFVFMMSVLAVTGRFKLIGTLDQKALWTIIISSIFGALSWLFYFIALRGAPSTTKVASLDRLSLILVIIMSVVFLSEKLTWQLAVGGILATAGIVLIALA